MFVNNPIKFHKSGKAEFVRNPFKRFAAFEPELSSVTYEDELVRAANRWSASIVRDGSLPAEGCEINTSPANGDKLFEQIDDLCAAMAAGRATANHKCGLHMHLDARDLSFTAVRRLVFLAEIIEEAVFQLVPHRRREFGYCDAGRYCRPCGKQYADAARKYDGTESHETAVAVGTYGETFGYGGESRVEGETLATAIKRRVEAAKHRKYESARYGWLNLHSFFFRGTIEIRVMPGTTSAAMMKGWAMLWLSVFQFAFLRTTTGETKPGTQRVALTELREGLTPEQFWALPKAERVRIGLQVLDRLAVNESTRKFVRRQFENFADETVKTAVAEAMAA